MYATHLLNSLIPRLKEGKISFDVYCYNDEHIKCDEAIKKISLGSLLDKILLPKISLHRHIWNLLYLGWVGRKYDLIYSFSSHGTLFHKNQVITIYDLICIAYPEQHKSQYFYFRYYMPLLIQRSNHVVTISNFSKDEVLKYYKDETPTRISATYVGIDHFKKVAIDRQHGEWVNSITQNTPFCIAVGASYPHKNIDTILAVAKRLENTPLKFIIVNKNNKYFLGIQQKSRELGLTNVIFLSYVSDEKLAALYKSASLNLYLSLYEGFGIPPAEALFFGTPSLLSNRGSLPEVYEGIMELINPLDLDLIAAKTLLLIKNPAIPDFEKLKSKYSWENVSKNTYQLICKLQGISISNHSS